MASRTLRDTGTSSDGRFVDFGASYFTVSDPRFAAAIGVLKHSGVVREWTDALHVSTGRGLDGVTAGPMRFAASGGLRSVVGALLADGIDVRTECAVERVTAQAAVRVDGDEADVVAVCMPRPQAARILDEGPELPSVWEPVIAVTAVFDERAWPALDGVFVNNDPVLTWIADDGSRRGDGAPVLVAHVDPVLSARHLDDPAAVVPAAVAAIQRVLGIEEYPAWVDAHRWTFAKPTGGTEAPYWLHEGGRVGVAGDEWSGGPRVEAAWLSGMQLGQALAAGLA
jgi:predicted NAD/FAD-dependent oxidoreductase